MSHAELNLNKFTKSNGGRRNCMKNYLHRHYGKMQLTGTGAGPHYLTLDVFAKWSQLWGQCQVVWWIITFSQTSKVLFVASPLLSRKGKDQWLLNWKGFVTLFWCFSNEPHVQFGLLCFRHMRNKSEHQRDSAEWSRRKIQPDWVSENFGQNSLNRFCLVSFGLVIVERSLTTRLCSQLSAGLVWLSGRRCGWVGLVVWGFGLVWSK